MKRILIFVANLLLCVGVAGAAVRDGTVLSRTKSDTKNTAQQSRISTVQKKQTARTSVLTPRSTSSGRSVTTTNRGTAVTRGEKTSTRVPAGSRAAVTPRSQAKLSARATVNTELMSTTRTGAEYEQCKNTYFACMDQFCTLKNDDYRRCSCNNRVFDLAEKRQILQDAGEKLTVFTENLDVVGMTAAQATAMRQESEGEGALMSDSSASKALLQAIMNSIRGDDATVAGKYAGLNSINIAFDTANAFGMTDVGQAIAAYDGLALYNAVYPQCRDAVRADCNDASLQRAITAYLMAIEQDCNTVQTAIEETQKQMKAAIREGSAMLDLARIENHQKHNSSNFTQCLAQVETAILSEEVCGANYHKCLDNGQYIDVSTGKPITGVKDFYKLEELLVFSDGVEAANQKLSKVFNNREFVYNFEARVKKFAEPALDKCVENADLVWAEYLDKAMLSIYYAQKAKVAEIKQNCFDYVATCYMNSESAIDAALKVLDSSSAIVVQPDKIVLTGEMCSDYVESCNGMFPGKNIIEQYVEHVQDTDRLTACRAIVQQCFDKYGGLNYENFYYPYSGLFTLGAAPDWFTLYEYTQDENGAWQTAYVSECAKQLQQIDSCNDPEMIERAFGGLDKNGREYGKFNTNTDTTNFEHRYIRPSGVATEVYNKILSVLATQCVNMQGRFVEYQNTDRYVSNNLCQIEYNADTEINDNDVDANVMKLYKLYGIGTNENICPKDYELGVDTQSWGICSCWENGARRSKWGQSVKCVPVLPQTDGDDSVCVSTPETATKDKGWCSAANISSKNQVCTDGFYGNSKDCQCGEGICDPMILPEGIE